MYNEKVHIQCVIQSIGQSATRQAGAHEGHLQARYWQRAGDCANGIEAHLAGRSKGRA
jgi:hypothetical protein